MGFDWVFESVLWLVMAARLEFAPALFFSCMLSQCQSIMCGPVQEVTRTLCSGMRASVGGRQSLRPLTWLTSEILHCLDQAILRALRAASDHSCAGTLDS